MEEFRKKTAEVFHQPPHSWNCAQSVAAISGRPEVIEQLRACGGGRAEGGLCGALYAALLLTPESKHDAIRAEFAQRAGALTCKEIKSGNKTPCDECVALGAWLVAKEKE